MKKFGLFICLVLIVLVIIGCKPIQTRELEVEDTSISEEYIPSEIETEEENVIEPPYRTFDETAIDNIEVSDEILDLIEDRETYIQELVTFLEENEAQDLVSVIDEIRATQQTIDTYRITYEEKVSEEEAAAAAEAARWEAKRSEYPNATYIWERLKDAGFSDQAAAGIIGNIMSEVGGQTLNIQYWLENSTYYGMCQWNRGYCPGVVGRGLEGQCDYLLSTIEGEFNTFGHLGGATYESFKNSTSVEKAALVFAQVYERCGSGGYSRRQSNAVTAYNYFME